MIDYYPEPMEAQSKSSRHSSPVTFSGSALSYAGWNAAICDLIGKRKAPTMSKRYGQPKVKTKTTAGHQRLSPPGQS
jgi:hypothetical protein